MCPGYPWDISNGYPTQQRQTRTFGSLSSKKNSVCLNCQRHAKNEAPYIDWLGPPTEGRAIPALLALALNLLLCWLTTAGWWGGLPLLLERHLQA